MYSENDIILIYIECHPMPVTASNGFPCLQRNWRSTSKSGFLGCQSSQFQGFFGKRWFKLCTWFWVCNILDLPFWIPCCILCVALSTAMNCWMSLQCFWLAKIAYDFVSGEACIFLSDSLTVSYLLLLGLRFRPAAFVGNDFLGRRCSSCLTTLDVLFLSLNSKS